MPLTTVDPKPALVVVDLQRSIVGIGVPGTAEVVARSARLLEAFRAAGHPVVLVNVDAAPGGRSDTNPGGVPTRLSGEQLDFVMTRVLPKFTETTTTADVLAAL